MAGYAVTLLVDIGKTWAIPAIVRDEIKGGAYMRPADDASDYTRLPFPDYGERELPYVFTYWVQGTGEISGEGFFSGPTTEPGPIDSYRECRLVFEVAYRYGHTGQNDDAEEQCATFADIISRRLYESRNAGEKPAGLSTFIPAAAPFADKINPDKKLAVCAIQWDCLVKASRMGLAA